MAQCPEYRDTLKEVTIELICIYICIYKIKMKC